MNPKDIINIIHEHKLWIDSGCIDGKRANLAGAILTCADLEGSKLGFANLIRANLRRANLRRAYLGRANLAGANLEGANLYNADLISANLEGANLEGANLEGAYLEGAILAGANLEGANLEGAKIVSAEGNGKEVRNISGLRYDITYTRQVLAIGCRQHTLKKWESFDDDEIREMDPGAEEKALDFWKEHKKRILDEVKANHKEISDERN